jgi:hypothetical protein
MTNEPSERKWEHVNNGVASFRRTKSWLSLARSRSTLCQSSYTARTHPRRSSDRPEDCTLKTQKKLRQKKKIFFVRAIAFVCLRRTVGRALEELDRAQALESERRVEERRLALARRRHRERGVVVDLRLHLRHNAAVRARHARANLLGFARFRQTQVQQGTQEKRQKSWLNSQLFRPQSAAKISIFVTSAAGAGAAGVTATAAGAAAGAGAGAAGAGGSG